METDTADRAVRRQRLAALDGLRGVAALVVVTEHILISQPRWHASFTWHPSGALVTLFSVTPLRLTWAGSEAVWIFFVLSGFVLTRRAVAGESFSTIRYLVRRTLRINVPAAVAILVSVALTALPRDATVTGSSWLSGHLEPVTLRETITTMLLVFGNRLEHVNGALWTLQWEMWFSYLVPLVVVVAVALRRHALVWGAACVVVSSFGSQIVDARWTPALVQAIRYLPMFGVGVALACREERIHAWGATLGRRTGTILVGAALIALSLRYPLVQYDPLGPTWSAALGRFVSLGAAAAVIVLVLAHQPLTRLLERRPVQWVGVRSFSLYLIHEPVIMAVTLGLGVLGTDPLRMAVLYASALLAAAVFHRLVEEPTVRLGRRLALAQEPRRSD